MSSSLCSNTTLAATRPQKTRQISGIPTKEEKEFQILRIKISFCITLTTNIIQTRIFPYVFYSFYRHMDRNIYKFTMLEEPRKQYQNIFIASCKTLNRSYFDVLYYPTVYCMWTRLVAPFVKSQNAKEFRSYKEGFRSCIRGRLVKNKM